MNGLANSNFCLIVATSILVKNIGHALNREKTTSKNSLRKCVWIPSLVADRTVPSCLKDSDETCHGHSYKPAFFLW